MDPVDASFTLPQAPPRIVVDRHSLKWTVLDQNGSRTEPLSPSADEAQATRLGRAACARFSTVEPEVECLQATPDMICPRCDLPANFEGGYRDGTCFLCGQPSPLEERRLTDEAQAACGQELAEYQAAWDQDRKDNPPTWLRCLSAKGCKCRLTPGKAYRQFGVPGMRFIKGGYVAIVQVLGDDGCVRAYAKGIFEPCQPPQPEPPLRLNVEGL